MGTGLRRAGESDLAHQRVLHQRLTGLGPEPGHHVDDALRESRLFEQLYQRQRGRGGVFGRLDHQRVARRQGRRHLESEQQNGRVPRRDGGAHAQGLVARVVEGILVGGDHRPLDLVRQAAVIVVPLGCVLELAHHLADELAIVLHLDGGERFRVPGDQIAEPSEQQAALGRVHLRPVPRGECAVGCLHGAIHVVRIAPGYQGPGPGGIGIKALEVLTGGGFGPLTVDEHLLTGQAARLAHCSGHVGILPWMSL